MNKNFGDPCAEYECLKSGLKRYIPSFRQFLLQESSYDLFGVVNTRLGPEADDSLMEVQRYSILHQDRNTGGGGVLRYVRNNLKAKILHQSKTTRFGKLLKPEYTF